MKKETIGTALILKNALILTLITLIAGLALGVTPDGTLTGVSVIAQGETAGLGANCVKPSFLGQFAGIAGGEVAFTKTGKTQPHEIDAISGATITTRAVTETVNAGLRYAYTRLMPSEDGTSSENGDMTTEGGITP